MIGKQEIQIKDKGKVFKRSKGIQLKKAGSKLVDEGSAWILFAVASLDILSYITCQVRFPNTFFFAFAYS
jgi:hypothetical protein